MTEIDDSRPTISERYGVATATSDLRVAERCHGADIIVAAGVVAARQAEANRAIGNLGVLLLRLQAEYDGVKAELQHADERARTQEVEAARTERVNSEGHDGVGLAKALRKRTEGEIITARYLILSQLKTLREAKQEVGRFAEWLATKERFMKPHDVVASLAGRVLDVYLDPTCAQCDGTGRKGSAYRGEKEEPCQPCRTTGQRRYSLGNDERARWFAGALLAEMQRAVAHAASAMGKLLRSDGQTAP